MSDDPRDQIFHVRLGDCLASLEQSVKIVKRMVESGDHLTANDISSLNSASKYADQAAYDINQIAGFLNYNRY